MKTIHPITNKGHNSAYMNLMKILYLYESDEKLKFMKGQPPKMYYSGVSLLHLREYLVSTKVE